jgi:hypothetical protein
LDSDTTITTSPRAAADWNEAFKLSKTASGSPLMTVLMVPATAALGEGVRPSVAAE